MHKRWKRKKQSRFAAIAHEGGRDDAKEPTIEKIEIRCKRLGKIGHDEPPGEKDNTRYADARMRVEL